MSGSWGWCGQSRRRKGLARGMLNSGSCGGAVWRVAGGGQVRQRVRLYRVGAVRGAVVRVMAVIEDDFFGVIGAGRAEMRCGVASRMRGWFNAEFVVDEQAQGMVSSWRVSWG